MVRRELYINSVKIPLSEELSMPVTYQISDIASPETRQGNYSKTIDIPSSKEVDQLFGYIFDVTQSVDTSGTMNFMPDFNPNLKAEAIILGDTIEEFNGFAQLVDISVTDRLDIVYHVTLLGKLTNLFDDIGDKLLTDLDFSEYNHTYNRTEIENSWSSAVGQAYLYELIDRGYSTDLTTFPLENFAPSLYEREYLLKIFRDAGYVWSSTFLDSDFFKRQTVPFSSPFMRLGATAILNRKFRASKTGTTSLTVSGTTNSAIVFNDETTAPNFDTSSQYNNANGRFTVAAGLNGNFTFNTKIVMGFTLTPTTAGVSAIAKYNIVASYQLVKVSGATSTVLSTATQTMVHPGAFTTSYTSANPASSTDGDFSAASSVRNHIYLNASNVPLAVGDYVYVNVFYYKSYVGSPPTNDFYLPGSGTYEAGTYTLHTYADSYFFNTIDNSQIVEGMPVLMNDCLPEKIKQRDFVSTIIKKYNLYFEQDADQTNKFNIEPRPQYYNSTVNDWTHKLAQDKELKIIPMGALDFKHMTFKYKEDNDFFNGDYIYKNKETYGQRDIDVINDFVKNTKTIELIYSPTPSVGNSGSNRIIPRIIDVDPTSAAVSPHKGNIRSLYYAGLKSSNTTWYITDSTGSHAYTQYPFSGMVDDPYAPTIDIGFGVPLEIYWQPIFDTITYTNNNLFNRFYRDMMLEIASANSKLVEGWFDLSVVDIATLDFRKLYYFENEYFRLNKVIDYDPISSELTKCQFIKVYNGRSFTATTSSTLDDLAVIDDAWGESFWNNALETTPATGSQRMANNNTGNLKSTNGAVYGFNNRIGSDVKNYFITGNNNVIGDYAENVTIMDSSGVVVNGGFRNVTIVNSNGATVNESNVAIINGQYYGKGSSIDYATAGNLTYNRKARLIECDCTSGNVTINLPDAYNCTEPVTIVKTDSSAFGVIIDPYLAQLINGATTNTSIRLQYDSVTIISDGSQWFII